ncbi:type II toxin-antitoxin system HicA family toxin [Pantoea agglomerans]|uniref:type II toxin-antitoxin system HicA family toxin n=1 Tax=Enterobacter agglomerans TaxID=549 RepID=UPI003D25FBE5
MQQGAILTKHRSGSSHFKVFLGDRQSIFPDHGAKEMPEGTRRKILKDLGL